MPMRTTPEELRALLPYANASQARYLNAYLEHGSQRAAADAMHVNQSAISQALARVQANAARRGHSPAHDMTRTVPEGFSVKGVSTLYDGDGKVAAQWVKSRQEDEDRAAAQREFVAELCAQVKPRTRIVPAPKKTEADICVGYPIGDHHMGMYSYAAETGGDYDLKIAQQLLADSVDYLVDRSPSSDEAILANLGDFLHADNRGNRTPASGHVLDVDTRYSRVTRVAAFGLAHAAERLLAKHKRVRVVNVPGNHDPDSASWLSLVLEAWFKNEPRVTVDVSPAQFLFYQFGQNMVCMTHGHTIKLEEIPATMAAYQPAMWGSTKYRVAWTGHVHHAQRLGSKENRGAKVESFGVLPPNDAYGASRGFLSQREMHAITFKRTGGELGRATFNAELS